MPEITYPAELPVSARREDIAAALRENQVVIVAGETGSGKTTQLPKICLELGRGVTGLIGHTQPRRIAARSVAERIAAELGTELGGVVGYQVRFTEHVSAATLLKLMTDGILLAEIQSDPDLRRYDTIIIDEAHERSLNIDFLLGYLTRLLPRRPDLKVIITSATIDSERFAEHFAGAGGRPAPIIEVSGRTYPVEIRYRPLVREELPEDKPTDDAAPARTPARGNDIKGSNRDVSLPGDHTPAREKDVDQVTGICDAVAELMAEGPGDILVFLAGEADIRDADAALRDLLKDRYLSAGQGSQRGRRPDAVEVLPLYARLSSAEQHRIFQPHDSRRIVLATNVAETSLTVPGIRYVVDPGTARISRFSTRTKVQRLPIEPVSQASANQRSGRCGRVADGIAIRLYSGADFDARPEFTEPEILRTSLASVILQMASLGLGRVADFPFVDPPDAKAVRDGVQLLTEIGALADAAPGSPARLTPVGKQLARLPIDPRLGRMVLAAKEAGCVSEIVVIVAALSCQDVRERPTEKRDVADPLHARFTDPTSDFLAYLNLWRYLRTQQQLLSSSAFRRQCRAEFLNYLRFREWQDVVRQLQQLAHPLGMRMHQLSLPSSRDIIEAGGDVALACAATTAAKHTASADAIHRSLLAGLLSNVGNWDEQKRDYLGARGTHFIVWPGSGLAKKRYSWVMAAELVETSRLFARTVARIDESWIEACGEHLIKRQYSEPFWSAKRGAAMVHEKVTLYGLTVIADRVAPLARVGTAASREIAREMFIREALVDGKWRTFHPFVKHNEEALADAQKLAERTRRLDLLADEEAREKFFAERIPDDIVSTRHFDAWWKRARREDPELLSYPTSLLLPNADEIDEANFPTEMTQGDITLPLSYDFRPGAHADGITVTIPAAVLGQIRPNPFTWVVPGYWEELMVAAIRALPKPIRKHLVPAPETARTLRSLLPDYAAVSGGIDADGNETPSFFEVLAHLAQEVSGIEVPADAFDVERLPSHLRVVFRVISERGAVLEEGTDLADLQRRLAPASRDAVAAAVRAAFAQRPASGAGKPGGSARQPGRPAKPGGSARQPGIDTGITAGDTRQPAKPGQRGSAASSRAPAREGTPEGAPEGIGIEEFVGNTRQLGRPAKPGQRGSAASSRAPAREGTPEGIGIEEVVGLTTWPENFSTLPPHLETTTAHGMTVRGYPALVAAGPIKGKTPYSANLRILADAGEQAARHAAGVARLVALATTLPLGRVTSRWTGSQALSLAASPYVSTEALVADAQLAATTHLIETAPADVKQRPLTMSDFDALVAHVKTRIEDELYRVLGHVVEILDAQRELLAEVKATNSLALLHTVQDVREQAADLVYPGFVATTGAALLPDVARYLRGARLRLERAESNVHGDHAAAWQVAQVSDEYDEAVRTAEGLPIDLQRERTLTEVRWLIEELRISLFAQQLGTREKVSVQRIRKRLSAL